MNARNLQYISRYNSAANKKFADDKLYTKHFLESRGIGVAKLFHDIKSHSQLTEDFFRGLPDSFVIKPNRGLAGRGILVMVKKQGDFFITAGEKKLSIDFLYRHCIEILDGKYSISGVSDRVIFEERLEVHSDFREICEVGLPDIRVVVFNMVPVMAMVRVPTYESDGKANMEMGAIAMGVDIGSGRTTGAAYKSTRISKMPTGASTKNFQIPFWDEILLSVAKIQESTKIGYLGADLVITKSGVKVLEVNARPGLKIQIANMIPLRRRLDKVVDLKVITAEEGVNIAKTLFSEKSLAREEGVSVDRNVIGVREWVVINSQNPHNAIGEIRLNIDKCIIKKELYTSKVLDLTIKGKRLKIPVEIGETETADVLIPGKLLPDFYIDARKKFNPQPPKLVSVSLDEKMLKNIDEKVCDIDAQIKLLSHVSPQNLEDQKKVFFENKNYNPRFLYRDTTLDIESIRRELKRIPEIHHPLYPLYKNKIKNIEQKLYLIESVGTPQFSEASQKLYGEVTHQRYKEAVTFLRSAPSQQQEDTSEELDTKEAEKIFLQFLEKHKLGHWKIKIIQDGVVDVQVTKKNSILLKKGSSFRRNRLEALLVHEIGTHIFRFENGRRQPLRIFERGTEKYLQTEEGLAIWNQNQLGLHLGQKYFQSAYLVIAIYLAEKMGFADLFQYLKRTYSLTDDEAWKLCVKSKRGLVDTSQKGSFTKDLMYFYGYRDLEKYLKNGGKIKDLYYGKYSLEDVSMIKQVKGLVEPKYIIQQSK